jgi:outer membrane biosynthesis protein TonB
MSSIANLSREERFGLGAAALLHVALVAALMINVRDDPANLSPPERMEVSLASEVSLQATAPEPSAVPQASIAPVLAPEPAPVVEQVPEPVVRSEPEPEPRPRPTRAAERPAPEPRPTASPRPRPSPAPRATATARPTPSPRPTASARPSRPAPAPSARPSPRPTQATRGGGSRIGADFLEGTSAGERSETRGTPAATFGAAEQASLQQAINRELRPHWSAPQGVDAEKLVTVLSWELNRDGSLKGRPQVVSQSGINDSNRPQADLHAERAIRAVQLAAPFDLPEEFYDKWRRIRDWRFDRRLGS